MPKLRLVDKLLVIAIIFFILFMATVYSVPYFLSILGISSDSREGLLAVSAYQAIMAFVLPSFIAAKIISRNSFLYLSLGRSPRGLQILGVFFAYIITLPLLNQIIFWNEQLVFPDSLSGFAQAARSMENQAQEMTGKMLDTTSVGGLISGLLIVGVLTGIAEEIFFRGTLQKTLSLSGKHHAAIWITAFIFSAVHFQVFGFMPRMLLGAWFGYLLFWTQSIYVPIIAHALNNGMVVFCTWLSQRGSNIDFEKIGVADQGFPISATVSCIAFIIFIYFFKNFFFKTSINSFKKVVYTS